MADSKGSGPNPFWMSIKNNFSLGESIEQLLKSPDCSVETLIADDNFIQECKSGNSNLMSFLSKKKNLNKLLEYIIREPEEGASHNRGHKYPFIVSDILSSDNSALLDTFFADEHEDETEEEGEVEGDDEDTKEDDDHSFKVEHVEEVDHSDSQAEDKPSPLSTPSNDKPNEVQNEQPQTQAKDDEEVKDTDDKQLEEVKEEHGDDKDTHPKEDESVIPTEPVSEEKVTNTQVEDEKVEPEEPVKPEETVQQVENPQSEPEEAVNTNNEEKTETIPETENNIPDKDNKEEDKLEETAAKEEDKPSEEAKLENTHESEEAKPEESNETLDKEVTEVKEEKVENDENPIKDNNLKVNQDQNNDSAIKSSNKQDQDENDEKENKPITDLKKEDKSQEVEKKIEEAPTSVENSEEVAEEPKQEESNLEGGQVDGLIKKESEGEEDQMPDLIDETPIEDALPEDVIDTSSNEDSTQITTQAESETDPALKKHIIDILFDFIRTDVELNPVLCGYFAKFLYSLMNHNRSGFFTYVFNPQNQVVEYLIKHIYNRSISDCLIKCLPENQEDAGQKMDFAMQLLNSIESQDLEGKLNTALVLTEIMETKTYSEIFKTKEINERLFELIKSEDDYTVRSAFIFINALYKKFPFYTIKKGKDEEDNFAKMYLPVGEQNDEDLEILEHIHTLLLEQLEFVSSLLEHQNQGEIGQQYGEIIIPFGATRLQVSKFVTSIISQGNTEYALKLATCLTPLLNFCIEYPWNSMLHNNVEMIFFDLFKKNSKYSDEIRTALIAETGLADFIADIEPDVQMPHSGRVIRSGPIATFVVVANLLKNHSSEYVQEELEKSVKWQNFLIGELYSANENNERALAGHQSKANDSDEDSANYETSMDKLFAVFTNLKESHDSSRELDDSDEDEKVDTTSILGDLDKSSDSANSTDDSQLGDESRNKSKSKSSKKKSKKCKVCNRSKCKCEKTEEKTDTQDQKEPEQVAAEIKEEAKEAIAETKEDIPDTTAQQVQPEGPVKSEEEIAEIVEGNTYYSNSYWQVNRDFKLEDLLQDY